MRRHGDYSRLFQFSFLQQLPGQVLVRSILLLGLISIVGCTLFGVSTPLPPERAVGLISNESSVLSPFDFRIVNEMNDGKNLHILAELLPHTNWPMSGVMLKLSGLKEGDIVSSRIYPIKDLLLDIDRQKGSDRLLEGKPLRFALITSSEQLTDYQLELLWGDGKRLNPSEVESSTKSIGLPPPVLSIQEIQLEAQDVACLKPPCGRSFKVRGVMINRGDEVIDRSMLGVSFVWVPEGGSFDSTRYQADNEQRVQINRLGLKPGEKRPFRVSLDRTVPELKGGQFLPYVRVIQ